MDGWEVDEHGVEQRDDRGTQRGEEGGGVGGVRDVAVDGAAAAAAAGVLAVEVPLSPLHVPAVSLGAEDGQGEEGKAEGGGGGVEVREVAGDVVGRVRVSARQVERGEEGGCSV